MNNRKFLKYCSVVLLVLAIGAVSCKNESGNEEAAAANAGQPEAPAAAEVKAEATPEQAESAVPAIPLTSIEWEVKEHDFGDIPKGEKQKYVFSFTNTGDNPLVISSATAGCGCTVPKKPEEPIQPGDQGEIEVEYNGSGNGKISKNVTVLLNTDGGKEILNITANVIAEEAEEAQ